tara:strand:- start:1647 stop:2357 length:711 start_codon:yes stop_codon:yes gene_type:complete
MSDKELTYKEVWDKLSKIDCSDKIEKKMNLSYLSWAWAWGVLQEHYPQAQYLFYQGEGDVPYVQYPDGTAEVRCRVSIDNLNREMTLSVMDYKNNAVQNPNSRQVNDTKMRCLVKCLAMYGLGHYIYAGEDVPSADKEPVKKEKPVKEKPVKEEPTPVETPTEDVEADKGYGTEEWAELFVKSFLELSKLSKTKEAMTSYYKNNTKDLATLRDNFPNMKADLDSELKTIVSNLKED